MLCQPGWLSLERQCPVGTWKMGRVVFICLLVGEGNDLGLQVQDLRIQIQIHWNQFVLSV